MDDPEKDGKDSEACALVNSENGIFIVRDEVTDEPTLDEKDEKDSAEHNLVDTENELRRPFKKTIYSFKQPTNADEDIPLIAFILVDDEIGLYIRQGDTENNVYQIILDNGKNILFRPYKE